MNTPSENPEFTGDTPPPPAIPTAVSDEAADSLDVAAWRCGDHAAAGRLYDRHAAVVLSICRRSVSGRGLEEAEDATQETFIRAFRTLDRLERPEGFRPWLYTIARFVCSERRRSHARRRHHEENAMISGMLDRPDAAVALDKVVQDERMRRLDDALEKLPEDERLAIHLYYLETDPVKAAATALGISRSGFYKLLNRAKERLSVLMKEVTLS